jgi:hypothetical protein
LCLLCYSTKFIIITGYMTVQKYKRLPNGELVKDGSLIELRKVTALVSDLSGFLLLALAMLLPFATLSLNSVL